MFVKDTKTEQCKNSQIPYHRCFFFSGLIIGAFIDMFARFLKSESKCFQWRRCNLWSFLLEHACHNSTCTLSHPKRRCGMGNPMYLRKTGSGMEFLLVLLCFSRLVPFLFFFGTCWANTVLFMSCSVQDEGWFFWAFCKKKGLFLALLCFLLYFFDFFWHVQLPNKDAPYSKYWHLVFIWNFFFQNSLKLPQFYLFPIFPRILLFKAGTFCFCKVSKTLCSTFTSLSVWQTDDVHQSHDPRRVRLHCRMQWMHENRILILLLKHFRIKRLHKGEGNEPENIGRVFIAGKVIKSVCISFNVFLLLK